MKSTERAVPGMRRLRGKSAVVTDAGAGIGRAIALRMAEEGARVVVADVNEEGAEKVAAELEGDSLVQQADVTKEEEVEALVRRIVEEWGGLHVMINNCRDRDRRDHSGDHRTLGQGLGCVLEGNVLRDEVRNTGHKGFGGWINNKYVLHRRTDRHQGSGGLQRCEGAILSLTRAAAIDHIEEGVRVNCIAPGTVDTPWIARITAGYNDPEEARAQMNARQPHGRLVSSEEIAAMAAYLASDQADSVVGAVMVDGGMAAR